MTLYLKNATYIDWKTLAFQSTNLAVSPGDDGGIGLLDAMPSDGDLGDDDSVFDCKHRLVTQSFACGHHHIYSALARGMPAPPKIPQNFREILEYIWWRVDKALDLEMIEASALVSALYCVKNGVTFVIDHHASPFAIEGSLSTVAKAFDRVGVCHLLCYEISDRDGEAPREQGLAETENYLQAGNQGHVGLHASFTVGDALLKKAVALAQKCRTGIHVHVAEDQADQDACLKDHNQRVLERYRDAGLLDLPKSIFAHCIHLNAAEKDLLRKSGVWVVQNVESNQNNNVGLANCGELGEHVMLGTDGMHSDMLRSAKAAFLTGQAVEGIDMIGIYERFRNVHNYIAANEFIGDGDNNLVILDYNSPTEINQTNFLGHFAYGLDACHVDSVVARGQWVVKNKTLMTVDEDEILAFAREMGNKLWGKLSIVE
jgi:cytosine/adenosine deaminase-related metal-dependent hydrolase